MTDPHPDPSEVRSDSVRREANAIYQAERIVARVTDCEIDLPAKEIRFAEIHNSDELLLPEECEFRQYRLMIQKIADASRVNKDEPQKGRILRTVVAEILGHREQ